MNHLARISRLQKFTVLIILNTNAIFELEIDNKPPFHYQLHIVLAECLVCDNIKSILVVVGV